MKNVIPLSHCLRASVLHSIGGGPLGGGEECFDCARGLCVRSLAFCTAVPSGFQEEGPTVLFSFIVLIHNSVPWAALHLVHRPAHLAPTHRGREYKVGVAGVLVLDHLQPLAQDLCLLLALLEVLKQVFVH